VNLKPPQAHNKKDKEKSDGKPNSKKAQSKISNSELAMPAK